jgi:hypothetical protein
LPYFVSDSKCGLINKSREYRVSSIFTVVVQAAEEPLEVVFGEFVAEVKKLHLGVFRL